MKLPKILYVVVRDSSDGPWLEACRNKFAAVEEDGDVVGTYVLEKTECGKQLVQFAKVKP